MRIGKLLILIALAIVVVGCGSANKEAQLITQAPKQSAPADNQNTSKKNVALVMKTLTNPFFIEMEKGARKAEKELGINLIVKTGAKETSIDQQITIVEELIRAKVDAIVIAPASSTELIPVLKKAQDAKIPIINIDNKLDPEVSSKVGLVDVPFVSVNNELGAYLSAKYISGKISSSTQVAILEGIRSAKNSEDRRNGAIRAFKENSHVTLVAVETANWKIDEAHEVAGLLFKRYPNIGAIFCANDMMALGVIKYLNDTSRTGVLIAAYDALQEAKDAISKGQLEVTIDQQADYQGYMGVKLALQKIKGEKVSPDTLVDVKVVNKQTL